MTTILGDQLKWFSYSKSRDGRDQSSRKWHAERYAQYFIGYLRDLT